MTDTPPREPLAEGGSFTGRTRRRVPKRSVLVADRAARWIISLGGIGSIAAVSLVGLFLFYVVIPLFKPGEIRPEPGVPAGGSAASALHLGLDENGTQAWGFLDDGTFAARSLADGATLAVRDPFPGRAPVSSAFATTGSTCAFGFADGSAVFGNVDFASTFLDAGDVPPELRGLAVGEAANFGEGVVVRTPEGQFRVQELRVAVDEPLALSEAPLLMIDQVETPSGPVFAALDAAGELHVGKVSQRRNLLTGRTTRSVRSGSLAVGEGGDRPAFLRLSGLGDNVMIAWRDGRLLRLDVADPRNPRPAEELDLVPEPGAVLTAFDLLIGGNSILAGDDGGRLSVWFRVRPAAAQTVDGTYLVPAYDLPAGESAVRALAPSARSRLVAVGYDDGSVRLFHATSRRQVAGAALQGDGAVSNLALAPRDDRLLADNGEGLELWRVDAPHPETTYATLLRPVWYEGYEAAAHVWQSSSATDDFEPKYGLMPLIFGTLKATLYSLLFGLPLAMLAAIYTSEFLHPRVKARVKPAIEMMASLPSVVLGFLAALVFAPFFEKVMPQTLASFVTVPAALLLGAHLWQLLPYEIADRLRSFKLPAMFLALPLGIGAAFLVGPAVEAGLYGGDFEAWLDGRVGGGMGGWVFFTLPLSAIAAAAAVDRLVNPWLRRSTGGWSRLRVAGADLAKYMLGLLGAVGLALAASWLMAGPLGWDPRGSFVDTYVQRNAMVVGFVMGFAIIPIIYTIAEDALTAVPDHLRAASLGAGATPWQTAVRVVIPPAMSGLFSAAMIGLGRAVGETMIVLMAAGNTPVMEWNIFNGFRTLSANIAVELPEAVQNSTHFRTLFLAALTLFLMTFVLNTVAEMVRMRFRKKAYQL